MSNKESRLRDALQLANEEIVALKREAKNYKNILIGMEFEELDSLATEFRDTTQIGIVASQRIKAQAEEIERLILKVQEKDDVIRKFPDTSLIKKIVSLESVKEIDTVRIKALENKITELKKENQSLSNRQCFHNGDWHNADDIRKLTELEEDRKDCKQCAQEASDKIAELEKENALLKLQQHPEVIDRIHKLEKDLELERVAGRAYDVARNRIDELEAENKALKAKLVDAEDRTKAYQWCEEKSRMIAAMECLDIVRELTMHQSGPKDGHGICKAIKEKFGLEI
jgi:hypothetical protein